MRTTLIGIAVVMLVTAGCGGGADGASGPGSRETSQAARPSSPARISIKSPTNGQVVKGTVDLEISLQGAKVVKTTSTEISPTQGHIHVLLDGSVVSMNYGLHQPLPAVDPGTHTLRVEFVASDHLPFDPRVFDEIAFTEK